MFTITIEGSTPEQLYENLNNMIRALGVKSQSAPQQSTPMPQYQQTDIPAAQPQVSAIPTQQSMPLPQQQMPQYQQIPMANTVNAQPAQQSMPTSHVPQTFTQDQLALAAAGLMDAGKTNELFQILGTFGASTLLQVPADQYPALAAALRNVGAAI